MDFFWFHLEKTGPETMSHHTCHIICFVFCRGKLNSVVENVVEKGFKQIAIFCKGAKITQFKLTEDLEFLLCQLNSFKKIICILSSIECCFFSNIFISFFWLHGTFKKKSMKFRRQHTFWWLLPLANIDIFTHKNAIKKICR